MYVGVSIMWIAYFNLLHTFIIFRTKGAVAYCAMKPQKNNYTEWNISYDVISDVDEAVKAFSQLQKNDPFRLENMDIYSNLLYVKEMRAELAHLAHHCCAINKYTVQTCCIIGKCQSDLLYHW